MRRGLAVVVGLVIASTACAACASDDTTDGTARASASTTAPIAGPADPTTPTTACDPREQRDVSYATRAGSAPRLTTLDVYPAPAACTGEAGPVVVWVHGGGWSVGDKARVGAKLDLFRGLGAAVVSVNYRLAPRGTSSSTTASHHPDQSNDVAAAVAWAVEHSASFGADHDRVVLVGHSAGAHLVSLVGTDPRYLRDAGVPDAVQCVVALDTEGYDLESKVALGGASAALVRNAFGDDPAVWRDASPRIHAADGAPVRFLVVTRGAPRRQAEAVGFADAVNAAGGDAQLLRAVGYSHADVNRRVGEPGEPTLTPAVTDFFRACTGTD